MSNRSCNKNITHGSRNETLICVRAFTVIYLYCHLSAHLQGPKISSMPLTLSKGLTLRFINNMKMFDE